MSAAAAACIFCKIIKGSPAIGCQFGAILLHGKYLADPKPGEIPSMKIFESEKTLAFLDIGPLSKGHSVRHLLGPPHLPSRS